MTAGIKKIYVKKLRKRRKNTIKLYSQQKTKIDIIEILIFRALTDSYISRDESMLVNNLLTEDNDIKETVKKCKYLDSLSEILICLQNNIIVLLEVQRRTTKTTKKTEDKIRDVANEKEKLMLLSKYAVCDSKKIIFIKNQEACQFFSNLELGTSLCKVSIKSYFVLTI